LKAAERIEAQRHFEENLDVVEENHRTGIADKFFENALRASRTLPLREVKKRLRQLKPNVYAPEPVLIREALQDAGLACPVRAHDENEPGVLLAGIRDAFENLFAERRWHRFPLITKAQRRCWTCKGNP
jgi:hypothetical protein